MKQLPRLFIALGALCSIVGILVKVVISGVFIPPGAWPWLKMGGLFLLFSVAVSLLPERK